MSALNQLQRIMSIHQQIADGKYPSVAQLVKDLDVNERTIKRDIAFLRDQHAPIKISRRRDRQGYYYTHPFSLFDENLLEPSEILALCLAYQVAGTTQQTPFHLALQHGIKRLLALFGQNDRLKELDHVSCISSTTLVDEAKTATVFRTLLDGINLSQQVRVRYFTMQRNAEQERIIDPQWLYFADGSWYVLAYCHWRKAIRHFALTRFLEANLLPITFSPLNHNTINEYLHDALAAPDHPPVTARIWFDAKVAPRVRERYWGTSQQISPPTQDGGPCILTIRVSSIELLLRLLLPYGRHMRPVAPPELIGLLQEEVRGMDTALNKPEKNFTADAK